MDHILEVIQPVKLLTTLFALTEREACTSPQPVSSMPVEVAYLITCAHISWSRHKGIASGEIRSWSKEVGLKFQDKTKT